MLSADELNAKWAAEAEGREWASPAELRQKEVEVFNAKKRQQEAEILLHKQRLASANKTKEIEKLKADAAKEQAISPQELRKRLDDTLQEHGVSPEGELVRMALERYPADFIVPELAGQFTLTADQRIKIWCELLSYRMPKLKAMEVSGQVDASLTVIVRKFGDDAMVERKIAAVPVEAIVEGVARG